MLIWWKVIFILMENQRWDSIGGSGRILSNAIDMAKWMLLHLNGGKNVYGQQVMEESELDKTYKAKIVRTPFPSSRNYLKLISPVSFSVPNYALGRRTGNEQSYEIVDNIGSF
ncbi:hypothetical protein KUTeg_018309 [Tegillarca granosa]|uniref:Uncharacterized protein n=1 Tax=Tegillarca granosa TaxID=220873 RepID=A0ABQ9EK16_TEGGR|nr:hypothetical protein KUTeg_018309 [Tegillarca granosa]